MKKDELLEIAREAGFLTGEMTGGDGYKFPLIQPVQGNNCVVEVDQLIEIVRNAERRKHQADIESWKAQAAQAEKWRGMAHARHGDGQKVVQEIQREAAAYEREACAQLCEQSDCVNNGYFAKKIRERGEK